uniref:Uncharacterized protein n=1 Tax=Terrapene triunguis TaxID=2587831 RepID=A0A674JWI8_9SAUR
MSYLETGPEFSCHPGASTGPYAEPTHLAQQQDPWNRLHRTPTLSSTRKEVWYTEPEVPRDSLDFKLTSLYNHHKEQLRDKSQIVIHKETLLDRHRVPTEETPPRPPVSLLVITWLSPSLECPHTAATNSGYSRKENGSFFSQ